MVPAREKAKEVNATDLEHGTALIAGAVLTVAGMKKGGLAGALLKLGGVALLYRGQSGYRRLYDFLGISLPQTPTGVGKINETVRAEIVVERPREEVYRIWRNLENLPVFMDHLLSVHEIDDKHSLWVARAPAGMVIKWNAEIVNDIENELIAWQSLEGSGVDNAGSVRFSDTGNGATRIEIVLRYDPPADLLGIWFAKAFRNDPKSQMDKDLARFKQVIELGNREPARPRKAGRKRSSIPAEAASSAPADQPVEEVPRSTGAEIL